MRSSGSGKRGKRCKYDFRYPRPLLLCQKSGVSTFLNVFSRVLVAAIMHPVW